MITVVPAYGRDYKEESEVVADWEANKDFLIQDISSPWDGKYINKQDADSAREKVKIRYNKYQDFVMYGTTTKGQKWTKYNR